jgi:hypothetical protein
MPNAVAPKPASKTAAVVANPRECRWASSWARRNLRSMCTVNVNGGWREGTREWVVFGRQVRGQGRG